MGKHNTARQDYKHRYLEVDLEELINQVQHPPLLGIFRC